MRGLVHVTSLVGLLHMRLVTERRSAQGSCSSARPRKGPPGEAPPSCGGSGSRRVRPLGPDGQRQRREKHPCRAPEGQRPVFRCAHRWPSVSRRYPIGSGARCTGGPRRSRSGGDGRFTGTPACSSGGRSWDLHGPCDMATTAANLRRLQDAISNLLRFRPRASRAGAAWLMRLFPRCAAFASLPSSGPTSWRKR